MENRPLSIFQHTHPIKKPNTRQHTEEDNLLEFRAIRQYIKETVYPAYVYPCQIDALSPSVVLIISPVIDRRETKDT